MYVRVQTRCVQNHPSFFGQCYDEKGKDAAAAMDEDIAPWLKSFVGSVGREKAKQLLEGAGEFAPLR